jgi:hypothetical protein
MRQADSMMYEIDGFDVAMEERPRRNGLRIGLTILVISGSLAGDLVQHQGEEEKVVAVDEGDVQVGSLLKRSFEFQCGIHTAEPSTQNQHTGLPVRHGKAFG